MSVEHSARTVRGYSHLLLARYVETSLPPEKSLVVRANLRAIWARLPTIKEDSQASFADWTAMIREIAGLEPTMEEGYQRVFEAGKFVANHALSTALRLLVRFLRPSMFARKVTDLWKRDHNFGSLVCTMDGDKKMIARLDEVDGYSFVSAVASGWVYMALETMGCKDITCKEVLHPPPAAQDAAAYQIEVRWS